MHANLVADFAPDRWYVTLFYVLAVLAVGMHGVWSALQTLGCSTARTQRALQALAAATDTALTVGFLSVLDAVTTGLVT